MSIAGDAITFVDDGQLTGRAEFYCHDVTRRFASGINYLGSQDASRKRRPPSQSPGA